MASESYIRNASSSIQNDLKIFVGKKAEILNIKSQNKLVANKFYLAWDSGEIFFTSQGKQLIRYGGSNDNFSEEDIKEIVNNCTVDELRVLKTQITSVLNSFASYRSSFNAMQTDVTAKLEKLEKDTQSLIAEKVDEVLAEATDLTYSKTQIENLIRTSIEENDYQDIDRFVSREEISSYTDTDTMNSLLNKKMEYATGNIIASNVAIKAQGAYFCVQNSTDSAFVKGHIYYLNGYDYEDLTPAGGTSSGEIVTTPAITLMIDGQTSSTIQIGGSFSGAKSFTFSISGNTTIDSDLSFFEYGNPEPLVSVRPTTIVETDFIANLNILDVGKYTYTLSGQDTKGNYISGTYTLNVIAPIYYGASSSASVPTQTVIQSEFANKSTSSVTGTYNVTTRTNEYIWICTPALKTIDSFTLNGFMAPFENPITLPMTFNGITNNYNCYRSSEALDAAVIKLNVVGNN